MHAYVVTYTLYEMTLNACLCVCVCAEEAFKGTMKKVPNLGVNYGMVASNLPRPEDVGRLLAQTTPMGSVKVYTSDTSVLQAFANTGLSVVAGVPDEDIGMLASNVAGAAVWVATHIRPVYPSTNIVAIVVGNEVLTAENASENSTDQLLDAMENLWKVLQWSGLSHLCVSTTHSMGVLGNSYPPSSARFQSRFLPVMKRLLAFLAASHSPFMSNSYPYFAYKENPDHISLDYALFRPNKGVVDTHTGLTYTNLFDAQV